MLKKLIKYASNQPRKIEKIVDGKYEMWDNKEMDDDLFIHVELNQKEIFREFIYLLNKKKNFQSSHRNIGALMYYMGMHNIRSVFVLNIIEDQMDLYKTKFSPRTAFGFFCGALNLSSPKNYIHFSKQEYISKIENIQNEYINQEISEISQALIKNENLDKEEKIEIWIELHQNLINNNLEQFKNDFDTCYNILLTMKELYLYENELFSKISEIILQIKECLKFENIIQLHQLFKKIQQETQNSQDFQIDYQNFLKKIENVIQNEEDYIWRYDINKAQLRSYRELYQNRENDRYKKQTARFIPEGLLNLKEMKQFKKDILDNPKVMGFDYDNLKQYIEAPWNDEEEENQIQFDEENPEEIYNDLESPVLVDDYGKLKKLEQLTFQ